MAKMPSNIAKSVKDRLLDVARNDGLPFDVLLVRYALERLLYRLSISAYQDRFILKGGMLVITWVGDDKRMTRDADFLGFGTVDPDNLVADFREIMATECADGIIFDIYAIAATLIREEMEYGGVRLKTVANLEKTRIPITIDIGFGDALADQTHRIVYPTLLDFPVPLLRAYPPSTVIAEKFHATVVLGVLNGRMKDYYDLWAIPQAINISDPDLDSAIEATLERRGTPVPNSRPAGLSAEMAEDVAKQRQWRAYALSIELADVSLETVIDTVWTLVGPSCVRISAKQSRKT
jgi:predicted nucleotidyltransferase component of viral defense system